MESSDGLIILLAHLRAPDVREMFWSHFEEIPGERVSPVAYELSIADWDAGLWQEEIEWIEELLSATQERVVVWQFHNSRFDRYTVIGKV